MKIRTGYVSNSSSSSFVIIGEKITIKQAFDNIVNNNDVYLIINGAGKSGSCEDYVVKLDKESYNFFVKTNILKSYNYSVWKADKIINEYDDEKHIDLSEFKGKHIFACERDYSSNNDIKQIKEDFYG